MQTDLVRLGVMQISFGTAKEREEEKREEDLPLLLWLCFCNWPHTPGQQYLRHASLLLHPFAALLQLHSQTGQRRKNVRVWWFWVCSLFCGTPRHTKERKSGVFILRRRIKSDKWRNYPYVDYSALIYSSVRLFQFQQLFLSPFLLCTISTHRKRAFISIYKCCCYRDHNIFATISFPSVRMIHSDISAASSCPGRTSLIRVA